MSKAVKPNAQWSTTSFIYDQEQVVKALGIKIKEDEWVSVNCDGTNKVSIDIRRRGGGG